MDSKQRSKLKSLAQNLDAIIQVGKNGITDETIKVVNDAFNSRELIKVKRIESCPNSEKEIAETLSEKTKSTVVQIIGSKVVLYKKAPVKKTKQSKPNSNKKILLKKLKTESLQTKKNSNGFYKRIKKNKEDVKK